jgi:hypothetical protein
MLAREKLPTARRGLAVGLRALILFGTLGAGGCHTRAGTLPVDSPVYAYQPPENDDDDSDTNEASETGTSEEAGSGAKKE